MQEDIFGIEVLYHGSIGLVYQLLIQATTEMGLLYSLREEWHGNLEAAVHYLKFNSAKPSVALLSSEMICLWGMSSVFSALEEKARTDPTTGAVYLGYLCMESVQAL